MGSFDTDGSLDGGGNGVCQFGLECVRDVWKRRLVWGDGIGNVEGYFLCRNRHVGGGDWKDEDVLLSFDVEKLMRRRIGRVGQGQVEDVTACDCLFVYLLDGRSSYLKAFIDAP